VPPDVHPISFEARLPVDMGRIRAVRTWVETLLTAEGWSEEDTADVGLVATEILQNAIEHGSSNDGRETVALVCTVAERGVAVLEIRDPGTGKGVASLLGRDVTQPPPIDAARGRGLFLVHRMAESLERLRSESGGSLVRVRYRATDPLRP